MGRLIAIDERECRDLLSAHGFGRVAVVVGGVAHIFPVNYSIDGRDIVFRSSPGTKLDVAGRGAVVTFEIDHADAVYHEGWSVVVTGIASLVRDPTARVRLDRLPIQAWADGRSDWIRVRPIAFSGRRVTLASDPAAPATP